MASQLEVSGLTILLMQIGLVLVVSKALGVAMRYLGQPQVVAEIAAGIVLGPSVLGWACPEVVSFVFPESGLPASRMLSQLGLVLFMLLVGLELDLEMLKARAYASLVISHSSIAVPFVLGAILGVQIYPEHAPYGVSRLAFALFLGAAMSVTALPVLARILAERRLMQSPVGAMALACAAVGDVSAWCILAVVSAVARAQGVSSALGTCLLAIVFVAGMLCIVRPLLKRLDARCEKRDGLSPRLVTVTMMILLAASILTELIGIHALFGAFLLGAIVPRDGGVAKELARRLEPVSVVLLMPLFFAYSGMRTELRLLQHVDQWLLVGVLIACATAGKWGGTAVAARLTGIDWREAGAIGVLMNTRGLMELVVLNLGMDLGVISPSVFSMLVIMALVTTVATTPLLDWMRPERRGPQRGLAPAMSGALRP